MSNIALKVQERSEKSNSKKLRRNGEIPGVIYGEFFGDTIPVKMCNSELRRVLKKNNSGSIIEVDFNDKKLNCVFKEIQRNNMQEILHVDLQHTKPNENIKMRIPIKCLGQENLETKRLVLETFNLFLDLQGSVEEIPEFIEVDVSDMNFEDKLFAKDIKIPENITVLNDPETLLAIVHN